MPQRTELLSGIQRGDTVLLSWPAPAINAADSSVQSIRRIDVYRSAESPSAPLAMTETDFAARSTLVGSVSESVIKRSGPTLSFVDQLELAGQPSRLRYSIRFVNAAGQRAGFSNFVLIEPAAKIADPPVLDQPGYGESEIKLLWVAPKKNVDGSTPANILGYNIYRSPTGTTADVQNPLNSSLVPTTSFADKSFRFGDKYQYVVRSVSLGTNGTQVESLSSNQVEANPIDIYAPAAPSKPTSAAVTAPSRLSLFFAPNQEADLAGYNLYRSEDPSLPLDRWTKLNSDLLTKTTYVDEKVQSGHRYSYYVTAVDKSGNVSPPSPIETSEIIP